jgi:RNA polymerase sigma-70 factor (ECF subfamily)
MKVTSDAEYDAFYRAVIDKTVHRAYLLYGDWHQAQDAAQDALVAAYQQWESKIASRSDDERWLFILRVLANRRVSNLRRRIVHGKAVALLHRRVTGSQSIIHVETDVQVREAIRLMHALPSRQRIVAVLHWVEDIPLAEIASILGISASATKEHLARARTALRKQLDEITPAISVVREPL